MAGEDNVDLEDACKKVEKGGCSSDGDTGATAITSAKVEEPCSEGSKASSSVAERVAETLANVTEKVAETLARFMDELEAKVDEVATSAKINSEVESSAKVIYDMALKSAKINYYVDAASKEKEEEQAPMVEPPQFVSQQLPSTPKSLQFNEAAFHIEICRFGDMTTLERPITEYKFRQSEEILNKRATIKGMNGETSSSESDISQSPDSSGKSPDGSTLCSMETISMRSASSGTSLSTKSAENRSPSPCESIFKPPSPLPYHQHVTAKLQKYKLMKEGDAHVCFLDHTRTVISKILSFKFLRRWETHRLYLNNSHISSKTMVGFMDHPIMYTDIIDAYPVTRWDIGQKYFLRIVVPNGSFLLQVNTSHVRDQWHLSIVWKKQMYSYQKQLSPLLDADTMLRNLDNLVYSLRMAQLQDDEVTQVPVDIASNLISQLSVKEMGEIWCGQVVRVVYPLLENCHPSTEMCDFFAEFCANYPKSEIIHDYFTPVVYYILKHNVDFGKYPNVRKFLREYIKSLYTLDTSEAAIQFFISGAHGANSECPHPRVLPNLVSVCLASIFTSFEGVSVKKVNSYRSILETSNESDQHMHEFSPYLCVLRYISNYSDWLPGLAQLLQPVPVPPPALECVHFVENLGSVMEKISMDGRCEAHQTVLGIRAEKDGWFDIFCPVNSTCQDGGRVWGLMLEKLLSCCCKRKSFLSDMCVKQLQACLLLALRGHRASQAALCLMLEWELIREGDQRMQIVATLQSSESGREQYEVLSKRQQHLQQIKQLGGPMMLTLPPRSTDVDLAQLLNCGSFGNLQTLILSFTHVTSASAEQIIKLPNLNDLNLWATQFGDAGLSTISEHLTQLQRLNLCETPVTDEGISALASLKNLRKLNLNSTKLSSAMLTELKKSLPNLSEIDIRYTEAW